MVITRSHSAERLRLLELPAWETRALAIAALGEPDARVGGADVYYLNRADHASPHIGTTVGLIRLEYDAGGAFRGYAEAVEIWDGASFHEANLDERRRLGLAVSAVRLEQ